MSKPELKAIAPFNWDVADDNRFMYLMLNGIRVGSIINASDHPAAKQNGVEQAVHWSFDDLSQKPETRHGHVATVEDAVDRVNGFAILWLRKTLYMAQAAGPV